MHDVTSIDWVGKTVADVGVSPGRNGRCNSLEIIFTDGTVVNFGGQDENVIWVTLPPKRRTKKNPTRTKPVGNKKRHWLNRGLCADAKTLGVSWGHLWMVLDGRRSSKRLTARYHALKAAQATAAKESKP